MSIANYAVRVKRQPMASADAARHLRRTTLGPRDDEIAAATGQRLESWLNAQLALPVGQTMFDGVINRRVQGFPVNHLSEFPANSTIQWLRARHNDPTIFPDVLRQRIVYALSEFLVVGVNGILANNGAGAAYHDRLQAGAFGTFRALIESVTRSPEMSLWLTYYQNRKEDAVIGRKPDENYAREIMQLFTIGLWELRLNGTRKLSGELEPSDPRYVPGGTFEVPTYEQEDILNMARVFTGLTMRNASGTPDFSITNPAAFATAGQFGWATNLGFDNSEHESSLPKQALYGRVNIPAGVLGEPTLAAALDALTNHPCTAPYFAGRMIRLLTTSNPSPEYVARVASVFLNDGTGQVGNLSAVWKAIFLDQEAMAPVSKGLTTRVVSLEEHLMAAVRIRPPGADAATGAPLAERTGSYPGSTTTAEGHRTGLGNDDFRTMFLSPSVFGRWPAAFRPPGAVFNAGLAAPETFLLDEAGSTDLYNFSNIPAIEGVGNSMSAQDITDLTSNVAALIDRLSLSLTGNQASTSFKSSLVTAITNMPRTTNQQRSEAFRAAVWAMWNSGWSIVRV